MKSTAHVEPILDPRTHDALAAYAIWLTKQERVYPSFRDGRYTETVHPLWLAAYLRHIGSR